jgi:PAS domain S-box-containing protein
LAVLQRMSQGESFVGFEIKQQRKDGSLIDVSLSAAPLYDAGGNLRGFIGLAEDITKRKQLEEAQRTQARVLESMAEGVMVTDHRGNIIYTNPTFDVMFGYESEELVGQHSNTLNYYPAEENTRVVKEILESVNTTGTWLGEFQNRKKDGTSFFTTARISLLTVGGKKLYISVQEDTTARKRGEEEIRRLASFPELNPNPVLGVDEDGRVIYANPAAREAATTLGLPGGVSAFVPLDLKEKVAAARQGGPRQYLYDLLFNDITYAVNLSLPHDLPTARVYALDITKRKRAEEERQRLLDQVEEERDKLKALVESITDEVWYCDPAGNLQPMNRAAAEALGGWHEDHTQPMDTFISRLDIRTAAGQPRHLEDTPVLRSLRGETVKELEEIIYSETGQPQYRLVSTAPIRDRHGRVIGAVGVGRDITERKRAEDALRESREDLNRAQAVAHTGSWRLDVRQNELLWSDESHRIFGIPPGTPLTYETFLGAVHPEDKEYVDRKWTAALNGEPYDIEHRIVVGDTVRWVRERAELEFDHEGQLRGGFGTVQDITARKQAEEALRRAHDELEEQVTERTASLRLANELLLQEIEERQAVEDRLRESEASFTAFMSHLPGPAVMRNIQGRYLFANVAWEKMTGKTRGEWQGKTLQDIWPPEMASRLQQLDQEVLLAGEPRETLETLQETDGTHHFLVHRFPIRDRDGLPFMLGAIGIDITDRKGAEEALEHERRRFFTVLEGIPAYVVLISPDCKIPYANREFVQRFGDPGERRCYEFLFGLKEPCEGCKALEVFDTGVPVEWEWAGPDGNTYQIYDYPFTDVDGSPLVLEMGLDITDRKRAEEARNRLIEILEATPDFVGTVDTDRRLTYLNYAARHTLGIRDDEDITRINIRETHPQWAADLVISEGLPTAAREGSWRGETAMLAPDGREIPVSQVIVAHKDAAGQVQFFSTIARDISVLKQARESTARQAAILNGINRIFWETLAYESGEELGRVCLTVAEELTDSRFGFIYESNDQGGFDVLAFSDPGWDLGRISGVSDPTHLKNIQPVGLLARSLQEGKALLVNEPASHPDAGGASPGHPPLTAYLGMPLISGGRTLGLLGLGNKARGYTPADQDAVEILAPTIVEALMHHRARKDLVTSERKMRYLADQLLTAQENERKRLAAELHDELGHALLSLKLNLRTIERQLLPEQEALKEEIRDQLDHINGVIDEIRRLYHDLSPGHLEDLGLTKALRTLIEDFVADQPHLTWKVELPDFEGLFPPPVETTIYRLMQEALTNIGKHANPSSIMVSALQEEQQVRLTIEDDGQGFEVDEVREAPSQAQGLGLASMEERLNMVGGSFQVRSKKGEGTRLTFTIPTRLKGNGP